MQFTIHHKLRNTLARAATLVTDHGSIETPAFVTVGTKATVKALSPEEVMGVGGQVILANTYHLYLQPGEDVLRKAGGLHKFMNWHGPTMTDSGGFQVFSLGAAYGTKVSKLTKLNSLQARPQNFDVEPVEINDKRQQPLAEIDEEGVTFRSHTDGSEHRFTPERSMEIQHAIGADLYFAFDECTSPTASYNYQVAAMERTHRWAKRSLDHHKKLAKEDPLAYSQALLGIVQGGRHEDLRKASARTIAAMEFDGFGIGGSFDKEDMGTAVRWVNTILPEEKPRHLLGIGEPSDLFAAVENGCDLFDCVAATRMARNGTLYTSAGRMNILNTGYRADLTPIDVTCGCTTCRDYTRAYLAHLFRARELFAYRLASIHNLYFIVQLVKRMRQSLFDDTFTELKEQFLASYLRSNA